jgi:hypothetical protein
VDVVVRGCLACPTTYKETIQLYHTVLDVNEGLEHFKDDWVVGKAVKPFMPPS